MSLVGLPIPIVLAVVGLLGGTFGWFGRGLAFLLRRWWTGSPRQEHAAYLNSVADLAAKMRAHGMTLDEIQSLERMMRSPSIASSAGAQDVVTQLAEPGEPGVFETNYAMKVRTGASIRAAEGRLQQALVDLDLLIRDDERDLLTNAQEAWEIYRKALQERARQEYAGGTHAGLAAGLLALAETERREKEIRAEVDDRSRRYAQFNLSASYRLAGPDVEVRFDVINVGDHIYEIRNGTGVGVGAPEFGPRRGFFVGLSKDL